MGATWFFCKHFNHLPVPSIALPVPSVTCQSVPALPASVMLIGGGLNGDRALLLTALALEQAMGRVP